MTESSILSKEHPLQETIGDKKPAVMPQVASEASLSSSYSLANSSSSVSSGRDDDITPVPRRSADEKRLAKQQQQEALQALLLEKLAKQLAYYFSTENLKTDTYLQTLRNLNDGCVPVNVLANFSKVKALLWATHSLTNRFLQEEARQDIIMQAVRQDWTTLHLEQVDTATGKIVPEDAQDKPAVTIWAVRPNSSEQKEQLLLEEQQKKEAVSVFTNTILFRDVRPNVTKEEILHLLAQEVDDCPPVISVNQDVANCWYIVFDTSSHETMLRLVLELRCLSLSGEFIQCRLKPSTLHQAPSVDPVLLAAASVQQAAASKKKKRRSGRSRKKRAATAAATSKKRNQEKQQDAKNSATDTAGAIESSDKGTSKAAPAPQLGEEDFPTLFENKTVEWATSMSEYKGILTSGDSIKSGSDDEERSSKNCINNTMSDVASTATTASASTDSNPKKPELAGYAAAVRKEPLVSNVLPRSTEAENHSSEKPVNKTEEKKGDLFLEGPQPKTNVDTPTWGRGRSFADATRSS